MNKSIRKAIIAGNWKMNNTPEQTVKFIHELLPLISINGDVQGCETVLCVPFINIPAAVETTKGTNIKIGAQNVHYKSKGAYTGEISAEMLAESGVKYVIIGHSERRRECGETDNTVNKRLTAAISAGLNVILCVGERDFERNEGVTREIVAIQTKIALLGISETNLSQVIIAYEPVWAIGTGVNATPEQAEEVCAFIRDIIKNKYSRETAEKTSILYGGSMNADNAGELLSKTNVDGGLIGGASLISKDFSEIVKAALH